MYVIKVVSAFTVIYRVFIKYCVFSKDFKLFRTLAFICFPSWSVCVNIPGRKNTSAAAELAELRKITKLKDKTQYLMNTLYLNTVHPKMSYWVRCKKYESTKCTLHGYVEALFVYACLNRRTKGASWCSFTPSKWVSEPRRKTFLLVESLRIIYLSILSRKIMLHLGINQV